MEQNEIEKYERLYKHLSDIVYRPQLSGKQRTQFSRLLTIVKRKLKKAKSKLKDA